MERKVVGHESEVPQMKRIGIIGGFGQWATLDILSRIHKVSAVKVPQYGNRGYPPIDLRMVNRAPMKLNEDGSFPEVLEPSPELLEAARFVGEHADFLILPSNTPHLFTKEIEKAAGKPLLSIVDVTIDEVVQRNYQRVGVIAIGLTLDKGLYQKRLEERGIESIILPTELADRLDNEGIYPVQEGADPSDVAQVAYEVVEYLRDQKVNAIILGCTEVPILLGKAAEEPDIINPSQLLAEATVKKALR